MTLLASALLQQSERLSFSLLLLSSASPPVLEGGEAKGGEEIRKREGRKWGKERRGDKKSKKRKKLLGSRSKICHNSLSMGTVSSAHCHTTRHKVEYAHITTHTHLSSPIFSCRAIYYTSILLTFKTRMLRLSESPEAFYLYPFFRAPLRQNP